MFAMSVPWWEFVIRGIAVYAFLLIFLRLTGRRQYAQYDLFDMVLLLILANAVQNSMNAGDNSLTGGLISAMTLIACHALLAQLSYRSRWVSRLLAGLPKRLIANGRINQDVMQSELVTAEDLKAALRSAGCLHTYEVEMATIETNGQITIVMRNRDSTNQQDGV